MKEIKTYKDLIGLVISQTKQDKNYIYFITNSDITIRTSKFEPYCACYVGEYIDSITINGDCCGMITSIEENIIGNQNNYYDEHKEIVYKGYVTFYFKNGQINLNVHGEDNGYYGVSFTLPIEVIRNE